MTSRYVAEHPVSEERKLFDIRHDKCQWYNPTGTETQSRKKAEEYGRKKKPRLPASHPVVSPYVKIPLKQRLRNISRLLCRRNKAVEKRRSSSRPAEKAAEAAGRGRTLLGQGESSPFVAIEDLAKTKRRRLTPLCMLFFFDF